MTTTTTAVPMTRKARADESRSALLTAAVECFSAAPYDAVAVSDIAKAANVAHGLVFHHFTNKRGIYLAAMREAGRQLEVAERTRPTDPPGAQLRQLFVSHLKYMTRNQDLAIRLILSGRSADPEAWEIFDEQRWARIEGACALLGLDAGNTALRLMLRSVAGAIDEATVFWLTHGRPFTHDDVAEGFVTIMAAALQGAARLDPSLDVQAAISALAPSEPSVRSTRRRKA